VIDHFIPAMTFAQDHLMILVGILPQKSFVLDLPADPPPANSDCLPDSFEQE
jgi:hypothetical protein